jgi:hypothetical protein
MLAGSEFVFEGRVLEVHTETGAMRGAIRTCAQFQVIEVIKGPPGTRSVELCFAGGAYGGLVLEVSGMVYPKVGEHGLYFVETLRRPLVHPLYGWEQGHFRIEPNEEGGPDIVKSADGHPVLSLNEDHPSGAAPRHPGIAAGVGIEEALSAAERSKTAQGAMSPLSPEAFKARLHELLGASRP